MGDSQLSRELIYGFINFDFVHLAAALNLDLPGSTLIMGSGSPYRTVRVPARPDRSK
jgi:hypothetical protein